MVKAPLWCVVKKGIYTWKVYYPLEVMQMFGFRKKAKKTVKSVDDGRPIYYIVLLRNISDCDCVTIRGWISSIRKDNPGHRVRLRTWSGMDKHTINKYDKLCII